LILSKSSLTVVQMGNVAIRNNELRNQFPKKILQKNARDEQVRARLYSLFQVDDCFPFF